MAISEDSVVTHAMFDTATHGSSFSTNHTPGVSVDAILVKTLLSRDAADTATLSSVTYGGSGLTAQTGSPKEEAVTGEGDFEAGFYLINNPATGTQSTAFTLSGTDYNYFAIEIIGLITAGGADVDYENHVVTESLVSTAGPGELSTTLALNGETCYVSQVFLSGRGGTGGNAPLTGWTDDSEVDFGPTTGGFYGYNTIGSSDVTVGIDISTQDQYSVLAYALKEASGGGTAVPVFFHHYRTLKAA